jgi:hypothetical protein
MWSRPMPREVTEGNEARLHFGHLSRA